MKRLHVHVSVESLEDSIRFYTSLFGATPGVVQSDYAKWMLDDPRVNFAISARGRATGVDHLGLQVERPEELADVANRLAGAGRTILEQKDTTCCYARSDKAWVADPQGVRWETFRSFGESTQYGEDDVAAEAAPAQINASACGCPATSA
jgi:catechol 2,3-dioxygenase-like lactoylglutathione lyase family enzyme